MTPTQKEPYTTEQLVDDVLWLQKTAKSWINEANKWRRRFYLLLGFCVFPLAHVGHEILVRQGWSK